MKSYQYETCCISSTAELINSMCDHAVDITYRTMLKHCEGLIQWAQSVGYDARSNQGLTLKDDWHVSYHKSTYDNKPCYYVQWSGIEHIWIKHE